MSDPRQDSGIPHMEVAILGAMMLDIVAVHDATALLGVDDFSTEAHKKIYRAMLGVMQDNDPVQIPTVIEELRKRKQLDAIGGAAYLAWLTEGIPRNLAIDTYVRNVKNKSLGRQARGIFQSGIDRITDGSEEPRLIISDTEVNLQKAVATIQEEKTLYDQTHKMLEGIRRRRSGEQKTFVTSGLEDIDFTHGGFAIGELTIVGAFPGVGKSSLLRQSIKANCEKGDHCHLMTPEMSDDQVLQIFTAQVSKIPFRRIRHAERLTEANLEEIEAAARDIMQWPLTIDDQSPLSPNEMITRARTIKYKHNTKLFGLDYLQKMKFPGKPEQRYMHITDALVSMTQFAKNEQVAVVGISSLTEPTGKEKGRAPTIADFRGSGDIRYEANTAILIHREPDGTTGQFVREAAFIYGKARSDETGTKRQYFNTDFVCFESQQAYLDGLKV